MIVEMNVLLIAPKFHGYENLFKSELDKNGHQCLFITTTLTLSYWDMVINKFSKKFLKNRYYKQLKNEILKINHISFDRVVLVYGGAFFTAKCFEILKKKFCNAKFIYYNWDSVCNNLQCLSYYKLFDKCYSFDPFDCEKYNFNRLDNWYSFNNMINNNPKFDYGMLMTFSSEKAKSYLHIKKLLPNELLGKEFIVIPEKRDYLYNKIFNRKLLKSLDKNVLYYKWLSLEESNDFYNNCKAVIDIPFEGQNGLTTRTFEVLKQEKKLITTNKTIKQYEFYTPNNIFVVDENTREIPIDFFEKPFDKNYCIDEKYSLETFVKKLFDLDND